jgi:hypothetical protein
MAESWRLSSYNLSTGRVKLEFSSRSLFDLPLPKQRACYGNNTFVAADNSGTLLTSSDVRPEPVGVVAYGKTMKYENSNIKVGLLPGDTSAALRA